ncbi:MAG: pyridoxamine 5'-phosphate oxidase [Gracilimonas sp.]|uniref:pyridoxamine 5'-phosphate oxidase n=1 Tax=Gracilimonas TaxID=649462 RepID=UPI001B0F7D22|nr:pyridoxamine 5'-phosphate oxidase [Gracilimonas sp.]MBO6587244.1 pyridoxamine 5'-phosphate oxidase [Gracilimonas sp.]MBO6614268.1 pyridoxamine 5'-phosphate oxidase [Gracilimonas sp.]
MKNEKLQKLREDYSKHSLDESDVHKNPFKQFERWMEEAVEAEVPEPNAMTLATVDANQKPHTRIVLLKGLEDGSFIFYTNYGSDKGKELEQNPNASLCFLWLQLERQVRIDGTVEKIPKEESEAYFKQRPYKSQLGALASNQSAEVPNREFLEKKFADLEAKYPEGEVPMPESWGGYRVIPESVEFWQGRRSRLHDRIKYQLTGNKWEIKRLSP